MRSRHPPGSTVQSTFLHYFTSIGQNFSLSMIFVFLSSLLAEDDEIIEPTRCKRLFMVGGVCKQNNPWWSQPIPGIHIHMKQKPQVYYTSDERAVIIDFSENNTAKTTSKFLEESHIIKLSDIAVHEPYINFYVDGFKTNTNLFDDSTKYIYTQFNITVYEIQSKCEKFTVDVKPGMPEKYEIGSVVSITYNLFYEPYIENIANVKTESGVMTLLIMLEIVILILLLFLLYRKVRSGGNIPNIDIWRIPSTIKNIIFFVNLGGFMITYVITLLITHRPSLSFSGCYMQSVIPSAVLPLLLQTFVARFFRLPMGDDDFLSSGLFLCAFIITPLQAITYALTKITGSWRGLGIVRTIFWDVVMMGTYYITGRAIGNIGLLYPTPVNTQATFGDSPMRGRVAKLLEPVLDMIQVALCTIFAIPSLKAIIAYIWGESPILSVTILSSVFSILLLAMIIGSIRGFLKVRKSGASWMSGHLNPAALCFCVITGIGAYEAFQRFTSIEGLTYTAFAGYTVGLIALAICSFGSFWGSFIVALGSYMQPKDN